MQEVLEVYCRAYDENNPVVCIDESPQQLIGEMRRPFVDSKGTIYEDYEYIRNGVTDIYVICEPLAGKREFFVTPNHCAHQWAAVVGYIPKKCIQMLKK